MSNIIVMVFSPWNIVVCLLKKGLQRGGGGEGVMGTPGPSLATPLCSHHCTIPTSLRVELSWTVTICSHTLNVSHTKLKSFKSLNAVTHQIFGLNVMLA